MLLLLACSSTKLDSPAPRESAPLTCEEVWFVDADGDGAGAEPWTGCEPTDGYVRYESGAGFAPSPDGRPDCDDQNPAVAPGLAEVCDLLDNDCDTTIDEDATDASTWYLDADNDGIGGSLYSTTSCSAPAHFSANQGDCNDTNVLVYPGQTETCDGLDNDCDGAVDEDASDTTVWYTDADGDGYGDPNTTFNGCNTDGLSSVAGDCDDTNAAINPLAWEVCDALDNDCDGDTDEDALDTEVWYTDSDGDGAGDPTNAVVACDAGVGQVADPTDCDDGDAAIAPDAAERCDGLDNDCDGGIDEDATDAPTWYLDADGDGAAGTTTWSGCTAPAGYLSAPTDCDDTNSAITPGAADGCDGLDNDCDGLVDPGGCEDTGDISDTDTISFYVATDGADTNAGTFDAPFATVGAAQTAIRALKASGLAQPVDVYIRGGTYTLDAPLTFTADDSGAEATPIRYLAYEGETPVFSGGVPITGWVEEGDTWVTTLPEVVSDGWTFFSLWADDARRTVAREPDTDWYYSAANATSFYDSLHYNEGEIDSGMDLSYAYVHTAHDAWGAWETSRLPVIGDDSASNILYFGGSSLWGQYAGNRWVLENVPEALDSAGEWFLDPATGVLRYWPTDGEDPATTTIIAPVLEQLLLIDGDPDAGLYVEHLSFVGLTFAYADWSPDSDGYAGTQAAVSEGAAIEIKGGRNITIEQSRILHTGDYGIWFREGTRDCTLRQSEVGDLGAGAVRIGTTSEDDDAGDIVVDNNFLHHGGRLLPSGEGVFIGRSSNNEVTHNEIADFYYTGVQVGWLWGYDPSTAQDNLIAYNHIHHIGQNVLSDMGGVYTLGVSPGTQVRNNVIHDVSAYNYGGWGLYTDEGSSFITMEENLVYAVDAGTFHQHYGEGNVITNNILAFSSGPQLRRSRAESHVSFYFRNNIVYYNSGYLLYNEGYSDWTPGYYDMDYNVYYAQGSCDVDFNGYDLAGWQALGNDTNSVVADPLFADAANYDFTLDAASPALSLGFVPFDPSDAGLYGDADWVAAPDAYGWTTDPQPTTVSGTLLSDDFESTAVGADPAGATVWGESGSATVEVTDALAHTGSHSLRFVDAPDLSETYAPHIWYTLDAYACTTVTGRFSAWVEAGAVFYHEWRDWSDGGSSYDAGPSIYVDGGGNLYATWGWIGTVPQGEWLDIEIQAPIGSSASGTWDLTITSASGGTQSWSGLSGTPLSRLTWIGFVANGTDTATFYVDDLWVGIE